MEPQVPFLVLKKHPFSPSPGRTGALRTGLDLILITSVHSLHWFQSFVSAPGCVSATYFFLILPMAMPAVTSTMPATPMAVMASSRNMELAMADEDTGTGNKAESNSIGNQRMLINRYLDNHPTLSKYPRLEFADDGYTGTNFHRPQFSAMMEKVRHGEIKSPARRDYRDL